MNRINKKKCRKELINKINERLVKRHTWGNQASQEKANAQVSGVRNGKKDRIAQWLNYKRI